MIPSSVMMKLATIGLSVEQAEAVASMLSEVEAATKTESESSIEARRSADRARAKRRRARLDISSSDWDALSLAVRKRDGFVCFYCGADEGDMHCDHIVPLVKGGLSTLDNLVTACAACNGSKGGRTPEEWRP